VTAAEKRPATPVPVCAAAQAGYAPDSVYAEWTPAQRAAADRIERDYNARRSSILALAEEQSGHTVRGLSDDQLPRAATTTRRALEDIESGARAGSTARARLLRARLRDIEAEQVFRRALAETWHATEFGTHSYTAFEARGGLAAVVEHGAPPPSYDLAVLLDRERFERGLSCVLDWQAEPEAVAA